MFQEEHTSVYLLPVKDFKQLQDDIKFIRRNLGKTDKLTDEREWIPRLDFLRLCNISPSQFNVWKNQKKLDIKYIGKKLYVHRNCIDQYFNGDFSNSNSRQNGH